MKKLILEWSLIFSVVTALALAILWGYSRFVDRSSYQLKITESGSVVTNLEFLVLEGDFAITNECAADASGKVRPAIVALTDLIKADILRGDRVRHFTILGLGYHDYWNAPARFWIWSLRLSLLIPSLAFGAFSVFLRQRLKRLRRPTEPSSTDETDRSSPPSA